MVLICNEILPIKGCYVKAMQFTDTFVNACGKFGNLFPG